jgi:hypothetical protein
LKLKKKIFFKQKEWYPWDRIPKTAYPPPPPPTANDVILAGAFLAGQSRTAREARVHLDDEVLLRLGVQRVLYIALAHHPQVPVQNITDEVLSSQL